MKLFSQTVTVPSGGVNQTLTQLINAVDATILPRGGHVIELEIIGDPGNDGANPVLIGQTGKLSAANFGAVITNAYASQFIRRGSRPDDQLSTDQISFRTAAATGQKLHVNATVHGM